MKIVSKTNKTGKSPPKVARVKAEPLATVASLALDRIAKHWPGRESRDAFVAAVQAWLALQSNTMAKAAG